MTTTPLQRATSDVSEEDLQLMALAQADLPSEFESYKIGREGPLTNKMMADQGFPGSNAKRYQEIGRINGFMREFAGKSDAKDGANVMVATVVHLFDSSKSVHTWMHENNVNAAEEPAREVYLTDLRELKEGEDCKAESVWPVEVPPSRAERRRANR